LIDTNVLVYAVDGRNPEKQMCAITTLESVHDRQTGVLSSQILGEFFTTVTRKLPAPLSHADAERLVGNYVASWEICEVGAKTVIEAVHGVGRYQFSYWDALVWATARCRGIRYILSEDFNDGATIEGVSFVNPFREDGP
jgi:predicted nucleic acid-binding protein